MDIPVSTDSLLFNDLFLRSILLIPLVITIYVLVTIYKQNKTKFNHVDLIKKYKISDNQQSVNKDDNF